MKSRTKIMGHAAHPVLIVFPLGLLSTAVIFDILYLITDRGGFATASAYSMITGIVGGVIAAVFGFIDWLAIPGGTRAKRIGRVHGGGNVVVLALFAISWIVRANADMWKPNALALVCSFAGVLLALFTGWLGGELVERLGVGVDDDASLNASSSLTTHPNPMR